MDWPQKGRHRFQDFERDLLEETAQRSDDEREGDALIGENEPGVGIERDPPIAQVEREHASDEWHEPKAHEEEGGRILRWQRESDPRVGGGNAGDDRQRRP
jgi:hypothetical protein